ATDQCRPKSKTANKVKKPSSCCRPTRECCLPGFSSGYLSHSTTSKRIFQITWVLIHLPHYSLPHQAFKSANHLHPQPSSPFQYLTLAFPASGPPLSLLYQIFLFLGSHKSIRTCLGLSRILPLS